ncbi:acyltransferase family protein [Planococcus glaciei]|nr:acyltransferase family protein [Planococcus glaciei]
MYFSTLGYWDWSFAGRYALPIDLPYKINDTFYYALFFVIGAVLAKHREALGILFLKTGTYFKISLFAIALLLYNWHWNFGMVLPADSPLHQLFADRIIGDIAIGIGACIFFLFAIHSAWTEKILTHRIPMFLGKVSYSLYLVHPVVILALFYSLHAWVHPLLIFAMVPFVSLAIATVYHYSVEVTAMKTGKLLTSKKSTQNIKRVRSPKILNLQAADCS